MREYGVEVCSEECGRTVLAAHDTHWIIWEFAGEVMISKGRAGYCPACGTRVGIDERGSWRESMVPRVFALNARLEDVREPVMAATGGE